MIGVTYSSYPNAQIQTEYSSLLAEYQHSTSRAIPNIPSNLYARKTTHSIEHNRFLMRDKKVGAYKTNGTTVKTSCVIYPKLSYFPIQYPPGVTLKTHREKTPLMQAFDCLESLMEYLTEPDKLANKSQNFGAGFYPALG